MKNNLYIGVGGFKSTPTMQRYVLDVLQTGRLSYGPYISKFEKQFAHIHGATYGIMANSGTSALMVALQALKILHNWNDGDEVLVPATTFVATSNIVIHNNLKPVFVDVEADYYGIDTELIEAKITSRTRCIIPVHLFGMPCQIDKVMTIAGRHGLKIIEDSCETMFAEFDGKRVGSFGDIGCFSTYVAHLVVTGVGGIIITSNPEYAVAMRSLVNHGRDSIYISIDDDKNKTADQMKEIIARRFSFVYPGHSFRITELEGALGVAQLEEWEININRRRANAKFITEHLGKFTEYLQLPKVRPNSTHSFMMYPIVLRNEDKYNLCIYLENLGIETRDMLPLINQPFYKQKYNLVESEYPISKTILRKGFYIGCHPHLDSESLEHIIKCFSTYYMRRTDVLRPSSVSLAAITSPDDLVSHNVFSQIDLSCFNSIHVFDFYPDKKIGEKFREMNYDVIDVRNRSLLYVYDRILDKVDEDYVVVINLDGAHSPNEVPAIVSHIRLDYDLIIASRFLPDGKRYDDDSLIPLRGIGNRVITLLLNLVFDGNLVDSYQPFRAISLEFLRAARLDSKLLTNYQMSIRAVSMKRRIYECPSKEGNSKYRSSFTRTCWIAMMTLPLLIREKLKQKE